MPTDKIMTRWYQEPYVWFVIFFPVLAIVAGFITLNLAIESDDGMVVDDYYKQGLAINMTLARDKVAVNYGLEAHIQLDKTQNMLLLTLKSSSNYPHPDMLTLSFLHHTRAGHDQTQILKRAGDDTYIGTLPQLIEGNWYVQLTPDNGKEKEGDSHNEQASVHNWRLLTSVRMPVAETALSLQPFSATTN
ncbi:hypothetical protein BegalDRAFT_1783 [Beggiatoa alba B18LD]|uniref:Nitrogen fixation protein FixH n=1 Tax=Beggiatoa alba B18LD TaxID=395493 RepID=I3CGB5_9GAMM|nr:FixH family protein [Beggiatoa alba]EIJ42658.1 hypothetical protein BegalDRAFT_1783 [Beggiatoa alba B18LD]